MSSKVRFFIPVRSWTLTLLLFTFTVLSVNAQEVVPGELIVKMKKNLLPGVRAGFMGKMSAKGINLKASFHGGSMFQFKAGAGVDPNTVLAELSKDPDVEFVEPNYIIRKAQAVGETMQPLSYEQMAADLASFGTGNYSQSSAPIMINEAWTELTPSVSEKPIVAILDTGVDYNHVVFTQSHAIWTNAKEIPDNGIDDDGNGYVDDVMGWNFFAGHNRPWDDDGHGTHVSGIVIGAAMDIFGQPLLESKITVMPLKFLGADGSGDTANAVRAIDYAIANGARVINASWGGTSYSRALHEAFSRAYAKGILIVAAAGNSTSNNDAVPIYPSSLALPSLISVAASTNRDNLALFSNYGVSSVHIAAPGAAISSTFPRNLYGYSSGTSMAAPLVAGLGALILRESPQLTGYQVREVIQKTVDLLDSLSGKLVIGGRINILNAIRSAKTMVASQGYQPNYTVTQPERSLASDGGSSSSDSGRSAGGGCGTIASIQALRDGGNGGSGPGALIVLILMALPVLVWLVLRQQKVQRSAEVSPFDMRFAVRLEVSDTVTVKTEKGSFTANLKNISKGGLAFAFDHQSFDVNEHVTFVFTSRDGTETIEVAGRIVWSKENSVAGVQFDSLTKYMQSFFMKSYVST